MAQRQEMPVQRRSTDPMGIYTRILRPLAFRRDSELMHNIAIRSVELASAAPPLCTGLSTHYERSYERLQCDVVGLHSRNPLGVAAGYDKNARATLLWAALGLATSRLGRSQPIPRRAIPRRGSGASLRGAASLLTLVCRTTARNA